MITAREKTEEVLGNLAKKMEGVDVKSASEVTFDEAKEYTVERGVAENRFDVGWVDKMLRKHYATSALMIKQASLEALGEAVLDDEAAEAWRDNWIAMHKIDSGTSKIVADAARAEAGSKEKFDAIIEGMGGIIGKVQKRSGELGLGGVDFGVFTATYNAEMAREGGGDPVLAAQLAGEAWLKAKKPLVDFVGELDSLKSVTEAYNKTANKLFKKTMPTGWGKQFNTLQDMQNIYQIGLDTKIITDTTRIDEQQLKMFDSMGFLTTEQKEQVELAKAGKQLWSDIDITWKSLFETGGAISEEQERAYEIAWGYETRILDEKQKQIEMMDVSQKLGGVAGKKAQFLLNVEKNISQTKINQEKLNKMIEAQEDKKELGYLNRKRGIELQTLALKKQLELMKEQETIQFKLVNIMQMSFTNLFEELVKGEENLGEVFKKVTRQMLIQMAQLMAQQAALAAMGFMFPSLIPAMGAGGREGGIFSPPGYKSFASGGYASGPQSGYLATLHGNEAVIPLGNDKSIPVKFDKSGGYKETNITVNVAAGGQQQTTTANAGERERKLGQMIAAAVQGEILDQQRPGGILSPYGDGGI